MLSCDVFKNYSVSPIIEFLQDIQQLFHHALIVLASSMGFT